MEFLAPAMLLGLVGVAAPIVLHLIGRRRARRVRFAAVDFLLGSDRKVKRRLRLRELLLLLARILVCLAIPLILAKPFTSCVTEGPTVTRGPQAAVLIIDNSFVSAYEVDGRSLLAESTEQAMHILDQLGPEAEVAVLATVDDGSAPSELSRDHIRLRDRIRSVEARPSPPDLVSALRRAAQLTSSSSHASRTIYLLAVPTAAGLSGQVPWTAEEAPTVRVVDPSGGQVLSNAAVTGLEIAPDPDSGTRGIRVTAEIANYGTEVIEEREVSLAIAGRVVARGLVTVQPGQRHKKRFTAVLPTTSRSAELTVELAADSLATDDRRYALAELRQEIPILLVNGDPRTVRYDDELFYLSAALRPGDRADSGALITITTPGELDRQPLDQFAVIVLANVPALTSKQVGKLRGWVETGGGLWITSGDNVAPDAYNSRMEPLLVQPLSGTFDLVHGARGSEKTGRSLRLAKLDTAHPILSSFPPDAPGLKDAAFSQVVLLGPSSEVAGRRVLARYDNGTAALVEADLGSGRLLFFTSSIDRDWNDLPIQPGFVPLVQQAARHLAGVSLSNVARQVLVGQQLTFEVPPDLDRVQIDGPDHRSVIEGERLSERRRIRFTDTREPGFYQVKQIEAGQSADEARSTTYAVNVDPRGSDLGRGDVEAFIGKAAATTSGTRTPDPRRRVELWHAVAAALLGFLLLESFLVWRR